MSVVALKELLEAGVHFGHQVKRWNPKMAPFIYTSRDDIHVIDLAKTQRQLDIAIAFMTEVAASGKSIVFVGTKKQAQQIVQEEAMRCGAFYVTTRWVGGLLTNWEEIQKTLARMEKLSKEQQEGEHEKFTKKENLLISRELSRLERIFSGVRGLEELPGLLVIADAKGELNAVLEARKRGVATVAICDTNSNPDLVDYPIPGNDDAVKAIRLIMSKLADAVLAGKLIREKKAAKAETEAAETEKAVAVQKDETVEASGKTATKKTTKRSIKKVQVVGEKVTTKKKKESSRRTSHVKSGEAGLRGKTKK